MGFLKKLFGSQGKSESAQSGLDGFFFYVQCDNCGKKVRLRIIKQYELNNTDDGYVWHKTIIDNRCFREIQAVVHFDRNFNVATAEINGGQPISQEEFETEEAS